MRDLDELKEKLAAEKALLRKDLERDGVQLIFGKLMKGAESLPSKMIATRDRQAQERIQVLYEVLTQEVPRIMETVMNSDFELLKAKDPARERWSFWAWVKKHRRDDGTETNNGRIGGRGSSR